MHHAVRESTGGVPSLTASFQLPLTAATDAPELRSVAASASGVSEPPGFRWYFMTIRTCPFGSAGVALSLPTYVDA